ncbi:MAG: helix-turn-helix domain-containing protein, partial [Saprospiraceae bacterium]|nr:helix-turn-helix domain-containing protein [Saprospiraceae bacterium]
LIVEDNADVVFYLQLLLQNTYHIDTATDGRAGLTHAFEHVPDIIISDVMMPGMDGFEVCKTLKTDMRTSHIPVILLTARADISSKIAGLQHGADAYLTKPFHKEELFIRLEKLLELRKHLQARYANAGADLPLAPHPTLEDTFMQRVRGILESHLDDDAFGVPDLCKALTMSRAQLYRKFQALTDQPVAQYFRDLRLHKAKTLLRNTNLRVSEIAFEVGFKDPAHFTRAFEEAFGTSPSKWRKG